MTVTDVRASDQERQPVPVVKTGSPAERFTSANPDDFAVPTGREEEWRFTPLRQIKPLFQPFTPDHTVTARGATSPDVTIAPVDKTHPLFGKAIVPADRVSALAAAGVEDALLITVPAHAQISEAVTVQVNGDPGLNYAHLIIDAGVFSSAIVVLDHTGAPTLAANVEIIVGDGATLTVISVQDWDAGAVHVAAHGALIGRDASYRHVSVNLGGELVRITPTVRFGGSGGRAELYGLSFADSGQHLESRLHVDHALPHCSSHVVYKSALQGVGAHTVWIGDVRIRPDAVGTSTYELNRNLLLTDGGRADSVPNLEIETGEIAGAGHASATGRFDEEHLFYLQSRGIPADQARRLVVRGFFEDVLAQIPEPALRERLSTAIDARLDLSLKLENV